MSTDLTKQPLSSVVALAPVLTGAVKLRDSLWTKEPEVHAKHLDRYIPTESSREALLGVLRGTRNAAPKRVHFVTGSYGTGKSYLLLVLASLLGLPISDPRFEKLLGRIRKGEEVYSDGLAQELDQAQALEKGSGRPGYNYLVVVPDYSDRQYDRALLQALREALDAAGYDDYRFPTEFAEAQGVLARWQQDREDFIAALRPLLEADTSSVTQLARQLEEHDGEALERFGRYFESVTGASYRSARVSLETTFKETSNFLQKEGYRGIAVLFDEFGFFLQEAASGRAGTAVASVQDFMEFARNRPSADIQLVLAAHRTLTAYGQGEGGHAEMKKMEGRLEKSYRLRPSAKHREAENMIAGAFVLPKDPDTEARTATLRTLRELAKEEDWIAQAGAWYPEAPEGWVQRTVVEETYPLHPTALLALPGLSDEVGQNTRTMFRFLAPGEPGGADEFIARSTVLDQQERLSMLTLGDLFDYFIAPANADRAGTERAGKVLAQYKAAHAVLRSDAPLAEGVLKTVAIITLFEDRRLQATPQVLRWALNISPSDDEDFYALLDVLVSQGTLRQNQHTKIYSFRSVGGTTTDALLAQKKRSIGSLTPTDLVHHIRETRPPGSHNTIEYNDKFKTNRQVAFDYTVPGSEASVIGEWSERFDKLYVKGDSRDYAGNLVAIYGLYEDEGDREPLMKRLRAATQDHPTLIAGVAAAPTALAEHALNVAATVALLDDPDVQRDENALNEFVVLLDQYQQALAGALDRALDPFNFEWYKDGARVHDSSTIKRRSLGRFLDEAVEQTFPDTPKINSDVVQEYPSSNRSGHRKDRESAIDRMLDAVPFSISGTGSADSVLSGLLEPNDMFEREKQKGNEWYGRVTEPPSDATLSAAWRALEAKLLAKDTPRRTTPIDAPLRILYKAPFGLSWPAAELVLGAFIAVHRDSFELRDKNQRQVPLSGESLVAACSSKKFSLVHQAITPAERRLLDALDKSLRRNKLEEVQHSLGPWADPAARLLEWYDSLPEVTKKRAGEDHAYVQPLFDALKEYPRTRSDEQGREFFTKTLPQVLDTQHWDNPSGIKELSERLEEALQAASNFEDEYAEQVLIDVAYQALEQPCSGSKEFAEAVDKWREGLSAAAKLNTYDSQADNLLKIVKRSSSDSTIDQYLSALPREWGMAPFRGWKTKKQRKDFVRAFRDAVREIDAYRASPLPHLSRLVQESLSKNVESEQEVDVTFRAWLRDLPEPTARRLENGGFGATASALSAAIHGTGTVAERYLQALPRSMPTVHGEWPNWPPYAINVLVQDVAQAVKAVREWEPPLSTSKAAAALLDRLQWPSSSAEDTTVVLDEDPTSALDLAARRWYERLPAATRRHQFKGLPAAVLHHAQSDKGLSRALAEDLPKAAGLTALHEAEDKSASERLVDHVTQAVREVESWERPVLEVLQLAASAEGHADLLRDESEYTLRLAEWARGLQVSPDDAGITEPTSALLKWARSGSRWRAAFSGFVQASGLTPRVHEWTTGEDRAFVDSVAAARVDAESWSPPPVDPVSLKQAVTEALRDVLCSTGANRTELLSVLFEAASEVEQP